MVHVFPLVSESQLNMLKEALNFLHVDELRDLCTEFRFINKGKKIALIARILHFIKTGDVIHEPKIPDISRAKRGHVYPLLSDTLIVHGAYKNDLRTRLFFKQLIGEHFHFTAFGIDWLNDCWMSGNPPTYQVFADMWQAEYLRRQSAGSNPKTEWAYINFAQALIRDYPNASHAFIIDAWKKEREKQVGIVHDILSTFGYGI